jgi:hypothetical protein
VTHIDYSARIQTVTRENNRRLHMILEQFEHATGCGVLLNTSFNVRGEPVVCTPAEAWRCFLNTEMDALAIGQFLMLRSAQPASVIGRACRTPPENLEDTPVTGRNSGPRLKEIPAEWQKFTAVWALAAGSTVVWLRLHERLGQFMFCLLETLLASALVWCLIRPRHFRGLFIGGMTLTHHLGHCLGKVMLASFYILILTPIGLLLRISGKDLLNLKSTPHATSHWQKARRSPGFQHQF